MRHETSLFRLRSLAALAALLGLSCRDARPAGDIRADFPAYCRATMACEGDNADAIHHVCMMSPIPFGMMLCEGRGARSVNACVAATETFRGEADAYGCGDEFGTLFRCLNQRSTCTPRREFDQSACRDEIRAMTSCVNGASGTHTAVATHESPTQSCEALAATCAACGDATLVAQCRAASSTRDEGTCAQALTAVRQSCSAPAS